MSPAAEKITRDQIEAKLREVTGGVTGDVEEVRSQALAIGQGIVVISVAVVFLFGRRMGRRKSTIVEVRRI
jgi:hypothetical protein